MKIRRRVIGIGVLIGTLVLAVLWIHREPKFRGMSAGHWLDQWETYDSDAMAESAAAFEAMGQSGIRFLIKTMETKPSKFDLKVSDWKDRNDLPAWVESRLPDEFHIERHRTTAIDLLAELGPTAQSAVPALKQIFKNPDEAEHRESVRRAIIEITESHR